MSFIKVAVAQLGAHEDYAIPLAFQAEGYLDYLYTDIYLHAWEIDILKKLNGVSALRPITSKLLAKHQTALAFSKVVRWNLLGVRYQRALRRASSSQELYTTFIQYGQYFNQAILQAGLGQITHLYAFDHAALALFQHAKALGVYCILNQIYPALYEEQLEQEEELRWPGWATAPRIPFYHSSVFAKWCKIQEDEWQLADTIIVNSNYSRQALQNVVPAVVSKVKTVPLTVNLDLYKPYRRVRSHRGQPIRMLFVGSVNLRKGIPYLLEAFRRISPSIATLQIVGTIQIQEEKLASYQEQVCFTGPLPYAQLPAIYQAADLFVFPTISDGFGAVMLEAMATGLPVIATNNCGDIVEDGINGYRIPIRDPEAIIEKIYYLYDHPEILSQLSLGAIATCEQYTLEQYQRRLYRALDLPIAQ